MTPRSPVSAGRMLTVLAYFRDKGGPVAVAEAAADLDLTDKQLRDTLGQLWFCGLPGYGPGELIDLAYWSEPAGSSSTPHGGDGDDETDAFDDDDRLEDADFVEVTEFAGITRPLRLTFEEAITLKTALATLAGLPEVVDKDGLDEALRMLSSVSPTDASLEATATPAPPPSSSDRTASPLRAALERGSAVRFVYHSAGSDSTRVRVVDGGHLHLEAEHAYLRGVDRESGEWRTFRTDRIAEVEDFGQARDVGPEPDDESDVPSRSIRAIVPAASAWFVEHYPFREVEWQEDGSATVTVGYHNDGWLRRFLLGNAGSLRPCDESLAEEISAEAARALGAYE